MNLTRKWKIALKLAVLGVLMLSCFRSEAKSWLLSNKNLELRFDDQTARFSVNDKRCNKIWEQTPVDNQFSVERIEQNGNTLNINFSGKIPFEAVVSLNESSALEINVLADKEIRISELQFPTAFVTPEKNH